ncbi:MAG: hypothetical protein WCI72_00540 [archaeon]
MISRSVALYEVPKTWERATVLDDSSWSIYSDSVKSKYTNKTAIQNLLEFDSVSGELAGSNIPMLVHLQEHCYLGDARLATRSDLEDVKKFSPDLLSGNQIDFGVALRGENVSYAPNKTSATNLVSQLKQRGIELGSGKLIPLSALTQREDANSGYGLTLSLKDDISADSIKDLADFKWDYITNDGFARAFLNWDFGWSSYDDNLASSIDRGRVVVVGPENRLRVI